MDGIALLFSSDPVAGPRKTACAASGPVADSSPTPACLLLRAPPEIRNLIYEHVVRCRHARPLVSSFQAPQFQRQPCMGYEYTGLHQMRPRPRYNRRCRPGHTLEKPVRSPPALGLLLACRQTYYEFSSVFYAAQTLHVRCSVGLSVLITRMSRRRLPATGLLPTPTYLAPKMHLFISTPVTQIKAEFWICALLVLAVEASGYLRELTLTFYHRLPTPAESAAGLPGLVDPDWCHADRADPFSVSDFDTGPNVDLASNVAFAEALCSFPGLERLDIRGLRCERWPAILDECIDRNLELQRAGFMKRIGNEDYSEVMHTFRAVYRRRRRRRSISGHDDETAADGQQQRHVPKIESDGTRHSLVATLKNAW
ncbi:hypothetical protein MN608_11322 [Microdochium nivale]|nr:hypothetical protein MN608_11322 [Microdochium nivale]